MSNTKYDLSSPCQFRRYMRMFRYAKRHGLLWTPPNLKYPTTAVTRNARRSYEATGKVHLLRCKYCKRFDEPDNLSKPGDGFRYAHIGYGVIYHKHCSRNAAREYAQTTAAANG